MGSKARREVWLVEGSIAAPFRRRGCVCKEQSDVAVQRGHRTTGQCGGPKILPGNAVISVTQWNDGGSLVQKDHASL